MTKKKLVIIGAVVLVAGLGAAYELFLKPAKKAPVAKIAGTIVSVGDPFTLNLAGGRYARVSVSVLLDPAPPAAADAAAAASELPQQDAVRSVITDDLTGVEADRLIDRSGRHELVRKLLSDLKKSTDEPVKEVFFTDLAVQ